MNGTELEHALDFEFYKVLLEPVRMKIIVFLVKSGEKNIKSIAESFPQDRTVISRQLTLMYHQGI